MSISQRLLAVIQRSQLWQTKVAEPSPAGAPEWVAGIDTQWYAKTYRHCLPEPASAEVCAAHYLRHASTRSFSPNLLFDERWYRRRYSDGAESEAYVSGWHHYLSVGWKESRDPVWWFSEQWYRSRNPEVAEAVRNGSLLCGFEHYLLFGIDQDLAPSIYFHPAGYRKRYLSLAPPAQALAPIVDYLCSAEREERCPAPFFDSAWYRREYLDDRPVDKGNGTRSVSPDPLEHYVCYGIAAHHSPSFQFDERAYLKANPQASALIADGLYRSGFEHYVNEGVLEGAIVHSHLRTGGADPADSEFLRAYEQSLQLNFQPDRRSAEASEFANPSSKKIHVFTSDILLFPGCSRSAGGDRSMQLISALREAGHIVTYSMPLSTYLGNMQREKIIDQLSSEELWCCEHMSEPDIVLARVQPDAAIFCNISTFASMRRYARDIVQILDLHGPLHLEGLLCQTKDVRAAYDNARELETKAGELVAKLRQVDYVITSSERQKYFWAAYLSLAGYSFNELDVLICPISYDAPVMPRKPSRHMSVVYSGGFYPWQNPDRFLRAAAAHLEHIDGAVLHIFGAPHAGVPNEKQAYSLIDELRGFKCVQYHGYRPIEELMARLAEAWCALELMDRNIERELAITGRTVGFLSAGTPVIYNNFSVLSELITRYDAGWTVDTDTTEGLFRVIDELAAGGLPLVERLSKNAQTLAAAEFNRAKNTRPLINLCNGPLQKRGGRSSAALTAALSSRSLGRVLSISGLVGTALIELRNANPLRALQRLGWIDGFTTCLPDLAQLADDQSHYDAILIQRTVPQWCYQTFANLGLPFLLDVDDNLLAGAAYRGGGTEPELSWGLKLCAGVAAPNPRLIRMLEKYSGLSLAGKAYMTPNALPYAEGFPVVTRPQAIVWIQSDIAALTGSKEAVVSAVEKFSVRHKLPVILIGRNVLDSPRFTHQVVMGEIDFAANLQWLDFTGTSIGVCPLETVADQETLDFIAGKSDLKMLLFDGYGHPGIYSAAPPYTESSLIPAGLLISNTHDEWMTALEYQYEEGWRLTAEQAARIRRARHIDRVAIESWLPALKACVLPEPVRGSDIYHALQRCRSQQPLQNNNSRDSVDKERETALLQERDRLSGLADVYRREAEDLRQSLADRHAALLEESEKHEARHKALKEETERLSLLAEAYKRESEQLRQSLSWKLTSPIRTIARPFME